jgi:hypothetical protein
MEATYSITKHHYFMLRRLRFHASLYLGGYIVFVTLYPDYPLLTAVVFLGGFLVYDVVPTLLLHWHYFRINQHTRITVNRAAGAITIIENAKSCTLDLHRIPRVVVSLSWPLFHDEKIGMASWQSYHFALLETNEGDQFIITCLLISNLQFFFKDLGIHIVTERRMFPFVYHGA